VRRVLPSAEVFLFYFLLLHIYKNLSEKQEMTVSQEALSQEFAYAEERIHLLNEAQRKMAVYQHDMRHHLIVLEGLLATGKSEQAQEFIQKIQKDLEEITPRRFCENDIVNLLCSSFSGKAEKVGVQLTVEAKLPKDLPLSDTELCSLLSNGLENALVAAAALPKGEKWVKLYCGIRFNKLLIEVQNPHFGEVVMQDGLPLSNREGHGYGCRSICAIAEQHHGLCTFESEDGLFTLRVMLPV
jgi:sensor histidine kinase regulating citrate/malate metabolism